MNCGQGARLFINNRGNQIQTYQIEDQSFDIPAHTQQEQYCKGETLTVFPSQLSVRSVSTYDPGSVMSFVAGLIVAYLMYKFIKNLLSDGTSRG